MQKAISPLIATVLVLAFTIAAAFIVISSLISVTKQQTTAVASRAECAGVILDIVQTKCANVANWWNSSWNYRLPVEISTGKYIRTDKLARLSVDFSSYANNFDNTSVRIVETTSSGSTISEVPSKAIYNNTSGKWNVLFNVNGTTSNNSKRYYGIYFDSKDNGVKGKKNYFTQTSFSITNQTGFPIVDTDPATYNDWSSPVFADVDGNGDMEIVTGIYFGASSNISVLNHDRTPLSGWPKTIGGRIEATPAIGDIDNDGDMEIIITDDNSYNASAFHHNGTLVSGWPVRFSYGGGGGDHFGTALYDLNNDGYLETIIFSGLAIDAWYYNGTNVTGFPIIQESLNGNYYNTPAIGDMDIDGFPEIVVGGYDYKLYAWKYFWNNGTVKNQTGWPINTGQSAINVGPAMADIDKDGDMEVMEFTYGNYLWVVHHNGTNVTGFPVIIPGSKTFEADWGLADIDDDGEIEILVASNAWGGTGGVWAFEKNGTNVTGWPKETSAEFLSAPTLGDIDGDGDIEVISASYNTSKLYAWHANGSTVTGFPIGLSTSAYNVPSIGDIDKDGDIEIAVVDYNANIWVFDSTGKYNPINTPWPKYRSNLHNTGVMDFDPYSLNYSLGSASKFSYTQVVVHNPSPVELTNLSVIAKVGDQTYTKSTGLSIAASAYQTINLELPEGSVETLRVSAAGNCPVWIEKKKPCG